MAPQVIKVDVSPSSTTVINEPHEANPSTKMSHVPRLPPHWLPASPLGTANHPASFNHEFRAVVANVASTADQEIDNTTRNPELSGRQRSDGPVALDSAGAHLRPRAVFVSSDPPSALLTGSTLAPKPGVVAIGGLVVESCA